jgi:hypothetical protein
MRDVRTLGTHVGMVFWSAADGRIFVHILEMLRLLRVGITATLRSDHEKLALKAGIGRGCTQGDMAPST